MLANSNINLDGNLLEKVIIGNDLAGLNSIEKVQYVKNICQSIGLNPLTKPIQLIKFQGKEVPYFTKDATEQLRKLHNLSLSIKETKLIDDLYIVIAEARTPEGRTDCATGAISILGLKGDAKANAIMKAETKAKRRATLSICGLGFMDESEVDSIKDAKPVAIEEPKEPVNLRDKFVESMADIQSCQNMDQLKNVYVKIMKMDFKAEPELYKKLVDAKDKRKLELQLENVAKEITGEVIQNNEVNDASAL